MRRHRGVLVLGLALILAVAVSGPAEAGCPITGDGITAKMQSVRDCIREATAEADDPCADDAEGEACKACKADPESKACKIAKCKKNPKSKACKDLSACDKDPKSRDCKKEQCRKDPKSEACEGLNACEKEPDSEDCAELCEGDPEAAACDERKDCEKKPDDPRCTESATVDCEKQPDQPSCKGEKSCEEDPRQTKCQDVHTVVDEDECRDACAGAGAGSDACITQMLAGKDKTCAGEKEEPSGETVAEDGDEDDETPTEPPPGEKKPGGIVLSDGEGVCGPDITLVLKLMVTNIESVWRNLPDRVYDRDLKKTINPKLRACLSIAPVRKLGDSIPRIESRAVNAWDSEELRSILQVHQKERFPSCSQGGPNNICSKSVMVDGKCHYAGSVNYAIFGAMWRLCGELKGIVTGGSLLMKAYVRVGKWWRNASNADASAAWSKAAYDGWPHATGVPSPPAEKGWPSNCKPTCKGKYLDPLHWWVQGLQPRGIRKPGYTPRNLRGHSGQGYKDNEPTPRFKELDGDD